MCIYYCLCIVLYSIIIIIIVKVKKIICKLLTFYKSYCNITNNREYMKGINAHSQKGAQIRIYT